MNDARPNIGPWSPQGFWGMLTEQERSRLDAVSEIAAYRPGAQLCREGDPAGFALIIKAGWIKIFNTAADGTMELQTLRTVGDLVGETALTGQPRMSTISTATDVRALVVRRDAFAAFMQDFPRAYIALQVNYIDRLIEAGHKSHRLGGVNADRRLARLLLLIANRSGSTDDGGGIALAPPLSQRELAQLIGAATPTVERILRNWRMRGIVATRPKHVTVINLHSLHRIAGYPWNGQKPK